MIGFDEGKKTSMTGFSDLGFGDMTQIIDDMFEMFGLDDLLIFLRDDVEDDLGKQKGGDNVDIFSLLCVEFLQIG